MDDQTFKFNERKGSDQSRFIEAVKTAKEVLAAKLAEEAHGDSDLGMLVDEFFATLRWHTRLSPRLP